MNCQFLTIVTPHLNNCGLGAYPGKVSNRLCERCCSNGDNTPERAAEIKTALDLHLADRAEHIQQIFNGEVAAANDLRD
jgi:hypothetical protein